jgi:hypothetical protein
VKKFPTKPPKKAAESTEAAVARAPADSPLHSRLQSRSKEQLVALVERLAADSPDIASRIDYLTDQAAAAKALQRKITSLRNSRRYVDYRGSSELASEIESLVTDINADVLPIDPPTALTLAEKLFCLDQKIFNRADDSGGQIGAALRGSCVLWLDAAAAVRASNAPSDADWVARIERLYQDNDFGIREPLLREGYRLLTEAELRTLAAHFERKAHDLLEETKRGDSKFHRVFTPSSAMGLIAEALGDPALYEQSIRAVSPEPNELQAAGIAVTTSNAEMQPVPCVGSVTSGVIETKWIDWHCGIAHTSCSAIAHSKEKLACSATESLRASRPITRWRNCCPRASAPSFEFVPAPKRNQTLP